LESVLHAPAITDQDRLNVQLDSISPDMMAAKAETTISWKRGKEENRIEGG